MTTSRVTTFAAAARLVGVTPLTIRNWRKKGWLGEPPWTASQLTRASTRGRQSGGRGSEAAHGTASRWRSGCDCPDCNAAHNADLVVWRDARATDRWRPIEDDLCVALASGVPYRDALEQFEVSPTALTGHRRRNPAFAARIDEALMLGRDPDLDHGSASGWRHKCRCPECREHHDRTAHGGPR